MKTFMIADLHFGDDNIRRYENRPFENVMVMDSALIDCWNNVVEPEDLVFVLGDFSAYDAEKDRDILAKLKGQKFLIMGNHDTHRTPEEWRSLGFDEALAYHMIYKDFFMLSHQPLYVCMNMPYANIFGHVHNNPSYTDSSCRSFCVSAERIGYTPIEFSVIAQTIQGHQK